MSGWNPGDPLSVAVLGAMTPAEATEHAAEIRRWREAGRVDGQPAPPPPSFAASEIAAMTPDEFEANRPKIMEAVRAGTVTRSQPPRSETVEFTREQIAAMTPDEFEANRDAIHDAARRGAVR